jgi:dolichol-phosphate mannosyltransferase
MNVEEISSVPIVSYEIACIDLVKNYRVRMTEFYEMHDRTYDNDKEGRHENSITLYNVVMQSAAIVIPTYNEAGNIGRLLDELFQNVIPKIGGWQVFVVVVDDNSPDGTGLIVTNKLQSYKDLRLVSELGKEGIGSAYMNGFAFAIRELKADVVIEFDADFQHPPETISPLLAKIDEGYDFVIGSRMIKGGGVTEDRAFIRALLTKIGGFVARFILFFPSHYFHEVTDPTSGLRATRVKNVLDKIDIRPEHLWTKSFGYKIQLLAEILKQGSRYTEIPLQFDNRFRDISKFTAGTTAEVLLTCLKARFLV